MFKKLICVFCLVCLTGCAKNKDIEVVETPPLSERAESVYFETLEVEAIGPMCGFINTGDCLEIYPYYDFNSHITLKKILISENGFWDTLITTQSEDFVVTETESYTLITTPMGVTFGYLPVDDEWAYLAETEGLHSGYIRVLFNKLCLQNT